MQPVTLTDCTVCGAPLLAREEPASEKEEPPATKAEGPVTTGPWRFISCKGACASLESSVRRMVLEFEGDTPILRCAVCGSIDDPHSYATAGFVVGAFVGVGALTLFLSKQIYDTFSWWKLLVVVFLGVVGLFLCVAISGVRESRRALKFALDHRARTTPFVPSGMDMSHAVVRTAGQCSTCGAVLDGLARSTGGICSRCGGR